MLLVAWDLIYIRERERGDTDGLRVRKLEFLSGTSPKQSVRKAIRNPDDVGQRGQGGDPICAGFSVDRGYRACVCVCGRTESMPTTEIWAEQKRNGWLIKKTDRKDRFGRGLLRGPAKGVSAKEAL